MTARLTLEKSGASGPLLPATLTRALVKQTAPRATLKGQVLRVASALTLDDDACAAFMLDFPAQGDRVRASANGPSAELLVWAFHVLAETLDCTLLEGEQGEADAVDADPDVHREAAMAYLARHEADVLAARRTPEAGTSPQAFLAWLAREEHIALAAEEGPDVDALASALPMKDAGALYEMLLESEIVDDVFVSERELVTALERFLARVPATTKKNPPRR
jgi:hypothetical protein